jgi:drug/metabolite transporter (DMT)-like permease
MSDGDTYYEPLLLAFVAILLWSLSASVARFLTNEANYLGFTLGIMCCGVVFFGAWSWLDRESWWPRLRRVHETGDRRDHLRLGGSLLGFGLFLLVYDFTFFYSVQQGPSVPANIINYMWPIFFPALGALVFRRGEADFGWFEAGALSLAFGGATLIAGGSLDILLGEFRFTYGVAFVAALSAGIYLNFLAIAQDYLDSTQFVYLVGVVVAIPAALLAMVTLDLQLQITAASVPFVVGYGFLTFGVGQVAWGKAISLGEDALISSLAYLTPVLSTIFLNVLVDAPITETMAFAAVLIVLSQVLLNDTFRHFSSLSGALVATFLTALVMYVDPQITGGAEFFSTLDDVIATLFAVLTGFMLNRVWQVNQTENERLTDINFELERLAAVLNETYGAPSADGGAELRRTDDAGADPAPALDGAADPAEAGRDAIYELLLSIVDLNYAKGSGSLGPLVKQVRGDLDDCEAVFTALYEGTEHEAVVEERFTALREHVSDWLMLSQERVSSGEIAVLAVLGAATIVLFIASSSGAFVPSLFTIALSGVVVFAVLKVRDYNANRTGAGSKALIEQQVVDSIDRPLYFPHEEFAFDPALLAAAENDQAIKLGRDGDGGDLRRVDEFQVRKYVRYSVFGLVTVGITLVVILLYLRTAGAGFTI